MRVAEQFISINGEGTRAGELAVFVRFQGCNLRCAYCDTQWANEADCPVTERTPEEIGAYVRSTGVKNVTLTGGEPLLQSEMPQLLAVLGQIEGIRVEIETNGAVDLRPFCSPNRPVFTMDYKLPGSGCQKAMRIENFLCLGNNDTVKFVCSSRDDVDLAIHVIREHQLTQRCHVYLSPVFGAIEPAQMVEMMVKQRLNDVRLQIQMHKVIWDPNQRGV